eukprot:1214855-Pyramimonas_sp.AAC.1
MCRPRRYASDDNGKSHISKGALGLIYHQKLLRIESVVYRRTPLEEPFTVPTQMVPDQSALTIVADEQREHLPKWGRAHGPDTEE